MTSGTRDQFLAKIGQRSASHGHKMYTVKRAITQYWVIVSSSWVVALCASDSLATYGAIEMCFD